MTRIALMLTTFALVGTLLAVAPVRGGQDQGPLAPILEKLRATPGQGDRPFCLVVQLKAKADQVDALIAAARKAVPASRAEAGCLGYDVQQSLEDATDFVILEQWRDAKALEFHAGTPHFAEFIQAIGGTVEGPPKLHVMKMVVPRP